MSVKGIKTDHQTKSVRYTDNHALLYPALPPTSLLTPFIFHGCVRYQRAQGAGTGGNEASLL